MSTTQNSLLIRSAPEKLYRAITTPQAIEVWQVPGNMTGKVHRFRLREGGGYEMSLFYPEVEQQVKGKSGQKEDRFRARFVELDPPHKVVQAIVFETNDSRFSGEMTMEVSMQAVDGGTRVTFRCSDIPEGISPQDNETGTKSSLEKLAKYVE